jgi:hypothetical protein
VRIVLVVTYTNKALLAMHIAEFKGLHVRTQVEVVVLGVTNADEEKQGVHDSYKFEAS